MSWLTTAEAFQEIYNYLSTHQDGEFYEYVMVGYLLKNTVTENGIVDELADHGGQEVLLLLRVLGQGLVQEGGEEDKPTVVAAIAEKTDSGLYPSQLWEV